MLVVAGVVTGNGRVWVRVGFRTQSKSKRQTGIEILRVTGKGLGSIFIALPTGDGLAIAIRDRLARSAKGRKSDAISLAHGTIPKRLLN